jgi:hypothetical protein
MGFNSIDRVGKRLVAATRQFQDQGQFKWKTAAGSAHRDPQEWSAALADSSGCRKNRRAPAVYCFR